MSFNTNLNLNGFTGMETGTSNYMGMNGMGGMNMMSSQNNILYQLQSILQLQLFKNFSTGNFFIDTLGQLFMMTFITYMFTQIKSLLDKTGSYIYLIFNKFVDIITLIYSKIFNVPIKKIKHVEIPYISDNRKINELYKAVSWYLSTNTDIDYSKETDLQYVYEKSLVPENINYIKSNLGINKIMGQNKKKEIKFKKYIIQYELNTELLTIYSEREKKRENYKIKLWVVIDQFVKTDILEEFSQLCITKYIDSLTSTTWKQQIYINKDNKWIGELSNNTRKLETVILQNSLKHEIKDDFTRFINSEEWYTSLDIPYNRGYMFYGRPGTGKTSLIRGISLHFKRHIHFLMLQNIKSDMELLELFKSILCKETIIVIEDIDAMITAVKNRELLNNYNKQDSDSDSNSDSDSETVTYKKININNEIGTETEMDCINETKKSNKLKKKMKKLEKQNKKLEKQNKELDKPGYKKRDFGFENETNSNNTKTGITLSGILNALDGIVSSPGRILIMTTNHPEILDDALIRPGRCDAKYYFDYCDKSQIKELYQMFFNIDAPMEQLEKIKACEYSPAHISSVFLRYRNEPEKALDHLDDLEQKIIIKPISMVNTTHITTTNTHPIINKKMNVTPCQNSDINMNNDTQTSEMKYYKNSNSNINA